MNVTAEILLSVTVLFLGFKTYELSNRVDALKKQADWTDTFMSKHEVDVKTGMYELNVFSDKIAKTLISQDKRLTDLEAK